MGPCSDVMGSQDRSCSDMKIKGKPGGVAGSAGSCKASGFLVDEDPAGMARLAGSAAETAQFEKSTGQELL